MSVAIYTGLAPQAVLVVRTSLNAAGVASDVYKEAQGRGEFEAWHDAPSRPPWARPTSCQLVSELVAQFADVVSKLAHHLEPGANVARARKQRGHGWKQGERRLSVYQWHMPRLSWAVFNNTTRTQKPDSQPRRDGSLWSGCSSPSSRPTSLSPWCSRNRMAS